MKRFLSFPNGINALPGVLQNFKINVDSIRCGAYFDEASSNVKIPLTTQMRLVILLELQDASGQPASDDKHKAFAKAINEALVSNPGAPIIDFPGWFINNFELTTV